MHAPASSAPFAAPSLMLPAFQQALRAPGLPDRDKVLAHLGLVARNTIDILPQFPRLRRLMGRSSAGFCARPPLRCTTKAPAMTGRRA